MSELLNDLSGGAGRDNKNGNKNQPSKHSSKKRILIVDDNKEFIGLLEKSLSHLGHAVEVALNGKDALEIFEKNKPEIIF